MFANGVISKLARAAPRSGFDDGSARADIEREHHHFVWLGIVVALALALAAAGAGTEPPPSSLAEVKALDRAGRFDEAIRRYRELLRQFPGSPEVRRGLATDLARASECERAASPEAEGAAPSPTRAGAEAVAGACFFLKSDQPAAIAHLDKALALEPGDQWAAIFLGRAYASSGKPEEGIRVLKAFAQQYGQDPDALYWTGAFYDQLAEQAYDSMAKSYPASFLVFETQGDQFLQQQKYDDALTAYEKALRAAPNAPGLHFDLGTTYWRMAKLDDAARELSAELEANPGHAQANFELGDIAVKQGDLDRGVPLLKKALALNPSLIEAHRSLGRACLATHDYSGAVREFSFVAKAEPSDHTIHALLANAYQRMGRTEEAARESREYNELMKREMSDLSQEEAAQGRDASSADGVPHR